MQTIADPYTIMLNNYSVRYGGQTFAALIIRIAPGAITSFIPIYGLLRG